jgi:tetratricopeptide (TPR) repeat protein
MARAAVKAKQAQQRAAQPAKTGRRGGGRRKHAGGGDPTQQLFFSRLRRRAKFMYLLLAVIFAATFAFLGVGSGSSGLQDLFKNINIFGSSNGSSVSKALDEIKKNPNAAKGFRDLATAYEAKGDTVNAISALQQYTTIKPKDVKAWAELGGLQLSNAQSFAAQYQAAAANAQLSAPSSVFAPAATSKLGKAIGSNPIEKDSASQVNSTLNDLAQRANLGYQNAVSSFQKVTEIEPNNSNAQFQLASAAQTAGNPSVAVGAYKKYLKLNPDSPSAAQIRQLIKQLSPAK